MVWKTAAYAFEKCKNVFILTVQKFSENFNFSIFQPLNMNITTTVHSFKFTNFCPIIL